jgi:hypothetical protein
VDLDLWTHGQWWNVVMWPEAWKEHKQKPGDKGVGLVKAARQTELIGCMVLHVHVL